MNTDELMQAVVVDAPGGAHVLQVRRVPKPHLKPGWSLVKVRGFGVNRSEIFTRQGLSPSVKFPRILGIECVGVVEETSDPDRLPVRRMVVSIMGEMGRDFDGSYAEYVLLPNDQIYPISTQLGWKELATVPETYYTAYLALLSLRIKPADTVLVRGATSGVGVAFAQLVKAKFPTVKIAGSSRNFSKKEKLESAGFDEIIVDSDGVLRTENTYSKVLELVGPKTLKNSLNHTEDEGILCSAGQLGGQWFLEDFDPIMELQGSRYLTTAYSGRVSQEKLQALFDYIDYHSIAVEPENIYSLNQVAQAHLQMEADNSFGKNIVLIHDEDNPVGGATES